MASVQKEILFLCVARRSDKVVLASRTHSSGAGSDYVGNVNKVLSSPGWASVTTDKLSLDDGPSMFYVLMDDAGRVYIAIATKYYPARYIYGSADGATRGILTELKRSISERFGDVSLACPKDGLQSKAGPVLKGLMDEFNDLSSIDKLSAVQGKVDAVRGVMQSNINQALKNTEKIEDIDDKAVNLAESANRFKNSSTQLKRSMRCRYIKMIIIMTALVAAILTVIIVPIVISSSK